MNLVNRAYACFLAFTIVLCTAVPVWSVELTDKEVAEFQGVLEKRRAEPKVRVGAQPEHVPSDIIKFFKPFEGIKYGGYVENYYQYESVNPGSGDQNALPPLGFHRQANSFTVNNIELWLYKNANNPGDIGFKITLNWGDLARYITPFGPVRDDKTAQPNPPGTPTGGRQTTFSEGYALWNIPVGKGLTAKFGKFASWIGYEDWESIFNPNVTTSYINNAATPNTNTGLGLSYPFTDRFTLDFYFTNTFDTFVNNNKSFMYGLQFDYDPPDFWFFKNANINLDTIWGPSEASNNSDWYQIYNLAITFFPYHKLAWVTNANLNHSSAKLRRPSGRMKDDNSVWGVAQYFIYDHTDWLGFAVRGEYFWDQENLQDLSGGTGASLAEVTFTLNLKLREKLMIRPEIRYDKIISMPGGTAHVWNGDNNNVNGIVSVSYEF
ncbi:MAG: outer membrane beta-barrel protein [Candidatus Brocadiales bacterium]|nr:outer membrane beta-barrel protein [Candidatus Bathyanammoxibius sp.]